MSLEAKKPSINAYAKGWQGLATFSAIVLLLNMSYGLIVGLVDMQSTGDPDGLWIVYFTNISNTVGATWLILARPVSSDGRKVYLPPWQFCLGVAAGTYLTVVFCVYWKVLAPVIFLNPTPMEAVKSLIGHLYAPVVVDFLMLTCRPCDVPRIPLRRIATLISLPCLVYASLMKLLGDSRILTHLDEPWYPYHFMPHATPAMFVGGTAGITLAAYVWLILTFPAHKNCDKNTN